MKKSLSLIFAVLLILSCFTACGGNNADGGIRIPEENPEGVRYGSFSKFTAVDLDGKKVDESIFKGKKLTMINIWATFCGPCINEMPALNRLHEEYADKDFQIIGIVCDVLYSGNSYDTSLYQSALDIVEMTGVTYTNLLPSRSLDTIKLYEVYSVPETVFVDENGEIITQSFVGARNYESWKAIVDSIMASMS